MNLTNKEFLTKLELAAKETEEDKPIEVRTSKRIVPTFVESEDKTGTKIVQQIATCFKFKYKGEEFETSEYVLFNKYGEADLSELKLWHNIVVRRDLKNVQPVFWYYSWYC